MILDGSIIHRMMYGLTDGYMDILTDGCMEGLIDGMLDGLIDGWMKLMDERTDELMSFFDAVETLQDSNACPKKHHESQKSQPL